MADGKYLLLDNLRRFYENIKGLFYSKTQTDKLLSGKAASSHTHTAAQVSGLPTSLPANGGNADMVDGLHANEIASNPNLLINPWLKNPINQRGAKGIISTMGYFIDRWQLVSGTAKITANGIILNGTMKQILENAVGANVTASSSAGTASYDNTAKTFTLTAAGEIIEWAKLEIGSVATPFVPPDSATELVKCQRYFVRLCTDPSTRKYGYAGVGIAGAETGGSIMINLPVIMRVQKPEVVMSNPPCEIITLSRNVYNPIVPTGVGIDTSMIGTNYWVGFYFSGHILGETAILLFRTNGSYLDFDAEML